MIDAALRSPTLSKLVTPGKASLVSQWVKASLTAEVDRLDDLVTVSFSDRDPQVAADVVNEIIRAYASFDIQPDLGRSRRSSEALKAEQTKQQAVLAEQGRDIHAIRKPTEPFCSQQAMLISFCRALTAF